MLLSKTKNAKSRYATQPKYIERLEMLNSSVSYETVRSMRAKLSWVCNTGPDKCAAVAYLSKVTERIFSSITNKMVNRVIKRLKSTPNLGIQLSALDLSSTCLLIHSDPSRNSTEEHESQFGYTSILMDKNNYGNKLQFSS